MQLKHPQPSNRAFELNNLHIQILIDQIEQFYFEKKSIQNLVFTQSTASDVSSNEVFAIAFNNGKWDIYVSSDRKDYKYLGKLLPGSTVKAEKISEAKSESGFFLLTEGQRWVPTESHGKCLASIKYENHF